MSHCIATDEMEEVASLYALGALSQQESRAFDDHLAEGCAICQETLRDFDNVAANLALGAGDAKPASSARDKLLARLEAETSRSSEISRPKDLSSVVVRSNQGEWQVMCAGVLFKQLFVDEKRNTVTSLLKLDPGASLPMHRHRGAEECYVIEGEVSANNETLKAGDYTCALEGSIHQPISTMNGALLLIVAPESFEVLHA